MNQSYYDLKRSINFSSGGGPRDSCIAFVLHLSDKRKLLEMTPVLYVNLALI